MKKFFLAFFAAAFFSNAIFFAQAQSPQKFEFKYRKGDSYRILSTVLEDVYVNNAFNHNAEILNRISVRITDVDENGDGIHEANFMTSENSTGANGGIFSYGEDYKSVFARNSFGKYKIGDEYFMPVVRDVPIFPERKISVGEKWSAEGHEAHDLRRTFGIATPFKIPFTAEYEYLGTEKNKEGKILHKFSCKYEMEYSSKDLPAEYLNFDFSVEVPVRTIGFSNQTIFWDSEKGYIDHYNEDFKIVIQSSYGNVFLFQGTAHAEVTDFVRTSNEQNLNSVLEKIEDLGISNVSVSATEKGLTLTIDNIQFMPDSDILLESEKIKLRKIAQILNAYPENDLLISGHTALRGSKKAQMELSELRARAVADYLIKNKVRDKYHIFTKGMGASVPIASNNTEAGRAKNRRVEITIMDK